MIFLLDLVWFIIMYTASYYVCTKLSTEYTEFIKGIFNIEVRWRNIKMETSSKERHTIIHTFSSCIVFFFLGVVPLCNTLMYLIFFRAVAITELQRISMTLYLLQILQDYRKPHMAYLQLLATFMYYSEPSVTVHIIFQLVDTAMNYGTFVNMLITAITSLFVDPWLDDKIIRAKTHIVGFATTRKKLHVGLLSLTLLTGILGIRNMTMADILYYYYEAYRIYKCTM